MLSIGVITRGNYGRRLQDTLADLIDEPAPGRVLYPRPRPHGPEPGNNPHPAIQGGRMLLPGSEWN